jgi:hypothetical protein
MAINLTELALDSAGLARSCTAQGAEAPRLR